MEDIAQQNANSVEQSRRDQAAHTRRVDQHNAQSYKLALEAASVGKGIVWDKDADNFLKERFTSKNSETGKVEVDATALQFTKGIALAESSRNGGDTVRAAARAMEVNDRMVADAAKTPDPNATLHELRSKMLASLKPREAAAAVSPISNPVFGEGVAPPPVTPVATLAQSGVQPAPRPQAQPQAQQQAQPPARHIQALEPLTEKVAQLSAILAQVAKSGDPRAIANYAQQLEAARAERTKAAVERLGEVQASEYLGTLPI
jgi:hypothetical protein